MSDSQGTQARGSNLEPTPAITVKSIHEPASASDGRRILVGRLWPRGVTKAEAAISEWRADWAPSWPLRVWFGDRANRWEEFCRRYRAELATRGKLPEILALGRRSEVQRITLVHAGKDGTYNVAAAVLRFIQEG